MISYNIWKLASCRRCRGDMHLDTDDSGEYYQCIQCGYVEYVDAGMSQEEAVAERTHRNQSIGIRGPHRVTA